jgi:hypothetical protein
VTMQVWGFLDFLDPQTCMINGQAGVPADGARRQPKNTSASA